MRFIFDSAEHLCSENKYNSFFDGILISNTNIHTAQASEPSNEEVLEGVGQFTYIKCSINSGKKSLTVTTDFLGMYELFYIYSRNDKRLIVSNNFRSLVHYFRENIGYLNIDTKYVVPLVLSNYNFFNLPFSTRTPALQIKRIPADKNLYFDLDSGLRFIEKLDLKSLTDQTYESLIERGVDNVRKRLSVINKIDCEKVFYMSGGKDSRASIALLNSTLSNKSFRVFSQNPKRFKGSSQNTIEKDLIITNKLCLLLSLKKISKSALDSLNKDYDLSCSLDFEQAYDQWMDSFSNIKYKCRFSRYKRLDDRNISLVEFHGLAGEVYRNYWSEYFKRFNSFDKKVENTKDSVKKDLQKFFYTFVKTNIAEKDIYEEAKKAMINEFSTYNGHNFYDKLNGHYNIFRNKYHFGGFINKLNKGVVLFSPLMDHNFLLASRKLSVNEKNSGKLLFDIVDNTNPYLNLFPFDSSTWGDELKSKYLISNEVLSLPDFSGVNSLKPFFFDEDNTVSVKDIEPSELKANDDKYNYRFSAMKKIRDNLDYLGNNEDSKELFNSNVIDYVIGTAEKSDAYLATTLGKIGSVIDIYFSSNITYKINPFE